jgi:DDE superfamily endonuclease
MFTCGSKKKYRDRHTQVHDGQYVEMRRDEFHRLFRGGHFVGDEHYAKLKRLLSNPRFEAPHRDTGNLTAKQKKYNSDIAHLRARIEMPFGWLKSTFQALAVPWAGELEQLDHLVAYATAIYNMM